MDDSVKHSGKTFKAEVVSLDGQQFEQCKFLNCDMRFGGGEAPMLVGCHFEGCHWSFSGQAANTLAFLSGFYSGGLDQLVESVFHSVRKGDFITIGPQDSGNEPPETGTKTSRFHPLVSRIPRILKIPRR